MQYDPERLRRIVRLAAQKAETPEVREWLLLDERGSHERDAASWLDRAAGIIRDSPADSPKRTMSEPQIDDAVAIELWGAAVQAVRARVRRALKKLEREERDEQAFKARVVTAAARKPPR